MSARTVEVVLRDRFDAERGVLVVADLPRRFTLIDGSLREASVYTYEVIDVEGLVSLEPSELFDPDDETGMRGRLRPAQSVGRLTIAVETADGDVFRGELDVAPTKLEQTREYRRMLEDIAEHAAEAVLQGFAPASLALEPSDLPAELLYNRLALLEARLQSDEFSAAMGRVLHQPNQGWESETELRPSGTGYPSGSAFGRALTAPGARRPWQGARGVLRTLPRDLPLERHETTYDTVANRFVKYALERWRDIAVHMLDALGQETNALTPGPVKRGRAAATGVVELLDELLGHELFRGVGRLTQLPTSNQVLLKREGYRQLFRTFALVEAAPALVFERTSIDDVYSASQRNIATLYEFWCYLVLAESVGRVCNEPKTAHAFSPRGDGLSLTLRAGRASAIRWRLQRYGRDLEVELYFNRQFSEAKGGIGSDGSWTRAMRPDCSIRVQPVSGLPRQLGLLDIWLHFDAKYRVDHLVEQLTTDIGTEEELQVEAPAPAELARSRRDDLLKMHAYRDAIHRTAGAYVLYPGDVPVRAERYTELLPGLGAFPLRPGRDESASGAGDLEQFLADVLTHVSHQASRHERERFWSGTINSGTSTISGHFDPAPFLDRPPADTDVLVGYVRSPEQRTWIERKQSYNVRADDRRGAVTLGGRELSAPLLLLYQRVRDRLQIVTLGRTGAWRAVDRDELEQSGYPQPRGRLYFVTAFDSIVEVPEWLRRLDLDALRPNGAPPGAPFAVSWWDLLHSVSNR